MRYPAYFPLSGFSALTSNPSTYFDTEAVMALYQVRVIIEI